MLDAEGGRRRSPDVLVVPFIFVPHGEPVPTEWLARRSDPIRVSATFVPTPLSSEQELQRSQVSLQPDVAAAPTFESGETHPFASSDEAEAPLRTSPSRPTPKARDEEFAIARYMRVNEFLDRIGLGHAGRRFLAEGRPRDAADSAEATRPRNPF